MIVLDPAHLQRQPPRSMSPLPVSEIDFGAEGGRHFERDVARAGLDVYGAERRHERDIDVTAARLERQIVAGRRRRLDVFPIPSRRAASPLCRRQRDVSRSRFEAEGRTIDTGDRDVSRPDSR